MVRPGLNVWMSLVLAAGCLPQNKPSAMVAPSPFDYAAVPAPAGHRVVSFAPAPTEDAARVDLLGRKLVAANPQLGIRPMFLTPGVPQPEIFHKGTQEVYITEGLVKQCQTDGQLAAVLCHELGKMVSEREALAGPKVLHPDRPPPIEVPIGNDNIGGTPDLTGLAERAKFSPHPPPASPVGVSLPPDPNVLARGYLAKAQFSEAELDNVQALLAAAAQNCSLERQLVGVATPPS